MKILFDFFPVLLFFIVFKTHDDEMQGMINATAVLIIATLVQVIYNWIKNHKINNMHLITLVMVLLFGGATIYFKDQLFLVWKVSIVHWLFSVVFLGSMFIGKHNILQRMMGHAMTLPDFAWQRLNIAWAIYFVFVGVINLYVYFIYYNKNFDHWVNFKLFGIFGLMFIFIIIQTIYLARYIKEEQTDKINQQSNKTK